MDKEKILKTLVLLIAITYGLVFINIFLLHIISIFIGYHLFLDSFLYWMVLIALIFIVTKGKYTSSLVFKIALYLFIIGAILKILTIHILAETIFRLSLVAWLVAIIQAFFEFLKTDKKEE